MLQLQRSMWTWKVLVCACLFLGVVFLITVFNVRQMTCENCNNHGGNYQTVNTLVQAPTRTREFVNNSGAEAYLNKYQDLFVSKTDKLPVVADPNNPKTITIWWQAAALIDWYINTPLRHQCQQKVAMGNWHICQDQPFTVKPPCLVYSFGINFDFSFDDAMKQLGCEVHSFDPSCVCYGISTVAPGFNQQSGYDVSRPARLRVNPRDMNTVQCLQFSGNDLRKKDCELWSMKTNDHKRGTHSTFHNMGLGSYNTDAYIPRSDSYVTNNQTWKMRTAKSVMEELGHENRVIDVFKMDVEGYEWAVLANMLETGVFKSIRQYMLELHLFPDFPMKQDYVYIYTVYTKLREMGFREFTVGPHPKTLQADKFNNQGDIEFVNHFFQSKDKGR